MRRFLTYLLIGVLLSPTSHAGPMCIQVFSNSAQSQLQDPLSLELDRKQTRSLKEKISKTEVRREVSEEINKMLQIVQSEGKRGDSAETKSMRMYAYARDLLVNRLLGWVSAKGGHDVPFYFVKEGTYQPTH